MTCRPTRKFACFMMVSALAAPLSGCGGSGSGSGSSAADAGALQGEWIEVTDADDPGRSQRMAMESTKPDFTRRLTIGDRSFTLTVCDADGKPLAGDKKIVGTWQAVGRHFEFTAGESSVDSAQSEWAPVRTSGVSEIVAEGGAIERLRVSDEEGSIVIYKRA